MDCRPTLRGEQILYHSTFTIGGSRRTPLILLHADALYYGYVTGAGRRFGPQASHTSGDGPK